MLEWSITIIHYHPSQSPISIHHNNRKETEFNQQAIKIPILSIVGETLELILPFFHPTNELRSFSSRHLSMKLTFNEGSIKMILGYVGVFHANTFLQQLMTSNENPRREQAHLPLNTFKRKKKSYMVSLETFSKEACTCTFPRSRCCSRFSLVCG